MNIRYQNAPKITVGEISNGECFLYKDRIYIKIANDLNVDTYEEITSGIENSIYDVLAVNLENGAIDMFSHTCFCTSVNAELIASVYK